VWNTARPVRGGRVSPRSGPGWQAPITSEDVVDDRSLGLVALHKCSRTSVRQAPPAIISSVRLSAVRRDSARFQSSICLVVSSQEDGADSSAGRKIVIPYGADKIYIRNGAQFVGDIQALGIVIEDGGFLCGRLELLRQSSVSKDTD
jgi:hypothetical protein